MRNFALFLVGCLAVVLTGCSTADTTGSTTAREYDLAINNGGGGDIIIYAPADITASTSGETDQSPQNTATSETRPNVSLAGQGATSTLATEGADQVIEGITSSLRRWQDNRKKTDDNQTNNKPATEKPAVIDDHQKPVATTERGKYHGRHNGDRPTWYFSKRMSGYPDKFSAHIAGCNGVAVKNNNGKRFESDGVILKQSDVSGRGMALVAPASCKSTSARVTYLMR